MLFFGDIISIISNNYSNNIKFDGKSYKNIPIYKIGYVTPNIVKPLYIILNKINGYIE